MAEIKEARFEVEAPAKVNVCLLVTGRRADGYHDVTSVMAPLELADVLAIAVKEGRGVYVRGDDPDVPRDEKNLAGRAALVFLAAARVEARVEIRIEKKIPVGAGLGGGSSDAAAALQALNASFGRPLGDDALWELARGLGSDVPFFMGEGWGFAAGRGEFVTRVRGPAGVPLLLAAPDRGLPTARVYQALVADDFAPETEAAWEVLARLGEPTAAWWAAGVNSLEAPACRVFPVLAELRETLAGLGYPEGRLSGSGGTFVAPTGDEGRAAEAVARLTEAGYRAAVTATR